MVAFRDASLWFGATENVTWPDPVPVDAPDTEIHEAFVVTDQSQPAAEATAIVAVPPSLPNECDAGVTPNVHGVGCVGVPPLSHWTAAAASSATVRSEARRVDPIRMSASATAEGCGPPTLRSGLIRIVCQCHWRREPDVDQGHPVRLRTFRQCW